MGEFIKKDMTASNELINANVAHCVSFQRIGDKMAKQRTVKERKEEFRRDYGKWQKEAIRLVDEMMEKKVEFSTAERIFKMAIQELHGRRSEEILERAEDKDAPMPC